MTTLTISDKEKFLINQEGQDFSHEAKTFIKLRELALKNLRLLDFPNNKLENWKYTSLREVSKLEFRPQSAINISADKIKPHFIENLSAYRLVFINGFFTPQFSNVEEDKDGDFIITNINSAKKNFLSITESALGSIAKGEREFYVNLNTAFSQDGAFVWVKQGKKIDQPVHVIHLVDGDLVASYPRNLIIAEKNSGANVITTFETVQSDSSLTNVITEVIVKDGAHVNLDKIQNENKNALHVAAEFSTVGKDATFTINTVPVNGKIVRNNLNISLDGKGSTANLFGSICLKDDVHVDNQTLVNHNQPNCESNELYKAVVNDQSTSVFNGKIFVAKIAQKTNAFQSNANILLSDDARAFAKPQLEIYADDVKCSHGCTIGQFDEEALFYLRARGIKLSTAKKVLLDAFIGEVLENISSEAVREYASNLIAKNFNAIKQ